MKISILNTSEEHPINPWLKKWIKQNQSKHEIQLLRLKKELTGGDILFLISCSELISKSERNKFKKTLVIHASDLPKGRGWSPHVWEIINGANQITLSLLEAEDKVDAGDIWKKVKINVPKTDLYDQINELVFKEELGLMTFAADNFHSVMPYIQPEEEISFWPKRTPKDSEVNIHQSIDEQFDLIRICDPERFPAFFYKNGKKFKLRIEVIDE